MSASRLRLPASSCPPACVLEAFEAVVACLPGSRAAERAWGDVLTLALPTLSARCRTLIAATRSSAIVADELALDALLAAAPSLAKRIGTMPNDEAILAYIMVAARRLLTELLHRGGDDERAMRVDAECAARIASSPFWAAAPETPRDAAIRDAVDAVLAQLPAADAIAARLFLEEGATVRAIMPVLGTRRIGEAHAARQRGLAALREALAPYVQFARPPSR